MQKNKKMIIATILIILLMQLSIASINPILKLSVPSNSIYNGTNGSIVFGSSAGPFSSNILINGALVNTTNIGYISKNINISEATQFMSVHNGTIYVASYPFSVVPIHTVNVSSFSFNTELYTIPNGVVTPYVAYSSNMVLKYVLNTSSSDLQTIYTSSNVIANTIVGFNKPIGVYTIPNSNSIYVLNNGNNTISLINSTFHVTKLLTTGNNPQSIAFSSNGVYAYVTDYTSNSVTVINVLTNTTIKNILINGACPSSIAYSNSTNSIYVADSCSEESGVSVINGNTNSYVGKISINGWLPTAISASPINGIMYVGYTNIASLSGVLGEINVSEGYVSAPASANTYTIMLNSNANANYNANSISSAFTISKATSYIFLNDSKNFVANGKGGYLTYGLFNKTALNNMNATLYVNGVLESKSYGMQLNKTLNESISMNTPEGYISNLALTNNGNDLYIIATNGKIADFNTISDVIVNNLTYAVPNEVLSQVFTNSASKKIYLINTPTQGASKDMSITPIINNVALNNVSFSSNPYPYYPAAAISPNGNYIYVADSGANTFYDNIYILNTTSNVITTIEQNAIILSNNVIVAPSPIYFGMTPNGESLYISELWGTNGYPGNGNATLSILNTTTHVISNAIVFRDAIPGYIAVPNNNVAYVLTDSANYNNLTIVNLTNNNIIKNISFGSPIHITKLLISNQSDIAYLIYLEKIRNKFNTTNTTNGIFAINLLTNTIISNYTLSNGVQAAVLSLNGSKIYYSVFGTNKPYLYILNTGLITYSTSNNSGIYNIVANTLGDANYSSESISSSFTIAPTGSLLANPITPSNPTIDAGQSITLNSNPTGGSLPYTYQWYSGTVACSTAITSGGTSGSYVATPTSYTSYSYKVTDNVANTICSALANVIVNSALIASNAPTSSASTLDNGQSATLSILSPTTGTPPYTYQWYSGSSSSCQSDNPITNANSLSYLATPTSTIYYCVKEEDSAYNPEFVYTNTYEILVTQNALSAPLISPSSYNIDNGQDIQITTTWSGGTAPYSVSLYSSTSSSCSQSSTLITTQSSLNTNSAVFQSLNPTATIYYCVYVTDSASTPVTLNSNTIKITVNPQLVAPIITPSSIAIDDGQNIEIALGMQTTGTSPYTYQWYNGSSSCLDSLISGATLNSITVSPNANMYYCAKIFDSVSSQVLSASSYVSVSPALGTLSISANTLTIDNGQQAKILSSINGGTTPYSYQWYSGSSSTCSSDSQISGATLNSITVSPTSTTYYCLSVSDSSYQKESSESSVKINVNAPLLSGSITAPSNSIYLTQNVILAANPSGGSSSYTYKWYSSPSSSCSQSSNLISGAIGSTYTASPTSNTYYCYVIVDSLGMSVLSPTYLVSVKPLPSILITPKYTVLDSGQTEIYQITAYNGIPPFNAALYNVTGNSIVGNVGLTALSTPTDISFNVYSNQLNKIFEYNSIVTDIGNGNTISNSSYNSIVVNPALTTPIITTPNITLSSSQSETINSIVYNGTVPYSYQWYSGSSSTCSSDSQISGATLNSITVSPTSTTYYCISVKDNSQIPVTLYSNTEKITITVQTSGGSSGGSGGGGGGGGGFGGGGGGGSITKKVIPNIKIAGYENKNVTLIYNNSSVIISAYNISNPDNIIELTINQTLENYSGSLSFGFTIMNYTMKKKVGRYNITALSVAGNKRTFILTITNNSTIANNFISNLSKVSTNKSISKNTTINKNFTNTSNSTSTPSNTLSNNNATKQIISIINNGSITLITKVNHSISTVIGRNFDINIHTLENSSNSIKPINITISNSTGSKISSPIGYSKKLIINLTIHYTEMPLRSIFINETSTCSSRNLVPFVYKNNSWQKVLNYTEFYSNGNCTASFNYSGTNAGIFAPIYSKATQSGGSITTTIISSNSAKINTNTNSIITFINAININYLYDLAILVTIFIIIYLLYHIYKIEKNTPKN